VGIVIGLATGGIPMLFTTPLCGKIGAILGAAIGGMVLICLDCKKPPRTQHQRTHNHPSLITNNAEIYRTLQIAPKSIVTTRPIVTDNTKHLPSFANTVPARELKMR
jgi:hypothetical protein